jgi:DNA polymerase III alpha subunit
MEDRTGVADVTVFDNVQKQYAEVLFRGGWLTVKGKVQRRGAKALLVIAEDLSAIKWVSELSSFVCCDQLG